MIGERPLFDTGHDAAVLARKLFPNQGLHNGAEAIAFCHPRGLQYLEQAPVLALGFAKPRRYRGMRAEISHADNRRQRELLIGKMRPLCEAGAPLKDVMAAFGFAFPLRRLTAFSLGPSDAETLSALSRLDPAVLGRIVPERPQLQRRWLGACYAWRDRLRRRQWSAETHFAWAAEAMALAGVKPREAEDVADFAGWRESGFSPAWGWKRAAEEQHRWHARLTMERALAGTPFKPDTVIDLGPHQGVMEVDGFEFVALRTPLDLFEEGAAMRHCVATYVRNVANGECHIVGVRQGAQRLATLEMASLTGKSGGILAIRQLKGPCNASVAPEVATAVRTYMRALYEQLTGKRLEP